jgi:ZIP family zinc transporter
VFFIIALFGPIFAFVGYYWLSDSPEIIGAIMLIASGGILYSIFQDIAPKVPLENNWAPPLGAILGFVTGLVGYMSIN